MTKSTWYPPWLIVLATTCACNVSGQTITPGGDVIDVGPGVGFTASMSCHMEVDYDLWVSRYLLDQN